MNLEIKLNNISELDMAKEVVEICEKSGKNTKEALELIREKYGVE